LKIFVDAWLKEFYSQYTGCEGIYAYRIQIFIYNNKIADTVLGITVFSKLGLTSSATSKNSSRKLVYKSKISLVIKCFRQ
jgi:hypothetical protein